MEHIVIKPKNGNHQYYVMKLLKENNIEFYLETALREYVDNQSNVNVTDGVSFSLTYDHNQSSTDDNLPSTADTNGLPGRRLTSDESNYYPPHSLANSYDAQQYVDSQSLAHGDEGYTDYQSDPSDMNESSGYDAYQYDCSQQLDHEEELSFENENDTLSMEPSTSTAANDSEEHNMYTNQTPKQRDRISGPNDIQCQICTHMFSYGNREFNQAQKHAVSHEIKGKLRRFKCPVDICGYRKCWMYSVNKHIKDKHQDREIEKLTPEQETEWVQHVKKCFPGTNKKEAPLVKKKCKLCEKYFIKERLTLREHAIEKHIGKIRVYTCEQPKCDFWSKHPSGILCHRKLMIRKKKLLI